MYNNGIQMGDLVFLPSLKQSGYINAIHIDQEGEFRYDVRIGNQIYEKLYVDEMEIHSLI